MAETKDTAGTGGHGGRAGMGEGRALGGGADGHSGDGRAQRGQVRDAATLGDAVGAVAGRKGLTRGARGALVAASLALRQDDVAALDALLELLDACLQLVLGHLLPFRVAGLDSAMSCFRSRTVLRASKSGTRGHPTNSTPCFLRAWCAL